MNFMDTMTKSHKVLIVEDELLIAADISEILEENGYTVVGTAATADEAIWMAKVHEPDIVLLDIVLSGDRDGISTAISLKRDLDPAIVFVTSRSDEMTVRRAASIPPNGFLLKPFRAEELVIAVQTGFANHAAAPRKTNDTELAASSAPIKGGLSPSNLIKVDDFLEKKLDQDISVATLANLCGLSEQHFSAQFKKSMAISPGQYIISKRIDEAKRMLMETKLPIAEIAQSVGYQNWAYFSTVFKRATGVTPSAYRAL